MFEVIKTYHLELFNIQHKILIVEDDDASREVMSMILEEEGYHISLATNISDAEISLKSIPDIILLDLNLGGTDGAEFCKRVKSDPQFTNIPVIITSAFGSQAIARARDCNAEDCLLKPFDINQLIAIIDRYIRIN